MLTFTLLQIIAHLFASSSYTLTEGIVSEATLSLADIITTNLETLAVLLISVSAVFIAIKSAIYYNKFKNLSSKEKEEMENGAHNWKGQFLVYKYIFDNLIWQLVGFSGIILSNTLVSLLMGGLIYFL